VSSGKREEPVRQRFGPGDAGNERRLLQQGFTLIEALVVVVILGLLAAVMVFAVGGSTDKAKSSACAAEERTLETAVELYHATEGDFPDSVDDLLTEPTQYLRSRPEHYTIEDDGSGDVLPVPDGPCAT
jgi:prepilin-type N-terminal cleavage/methylation domain-containing protein